MKVKLTVANLIAGVGGLVAFLFSFLGFWSYGGDSANAWDGDVTGFASAVPAILGLAMVVVIALELAGVALPDKVLTFEWKQIKATFGISAAGLYLSWVATSGPAGIDKAGVFWLQVLGGIAMAVGAIMGLLGMGSETIGTHGSGTSNGDRETPPSTPGGSAPPPPPSAPPPSRGGAPPPPPPGGATPPPPPPPPSS